jgi:TadE-like protein
MVEFVMVVPVILLLAFGAVGVGQIVHARMAASAVAREAARAAVLSPMPPRGSQGAAQNAALQRAAEVAAGLHVSCQLKRLQFLPSLKGSTFGPGSRVQVDAACAVGANALPMLHWQGLSVPGADLEEIDPYRSLTHP